jgi:hypothetical protein
VTNFGVVACGEAGVVAACAYVALDLHVYLHITNPLTYGICTSVRMCDYEYSTDVGMD